MITREDPPDSKGRRGDLRYTEIAEKLQADPGTWYRVFDNDTRGQTAHNMNSGKIRAFRPSGSFEATSRKNDDGTYTIWARHVGGHVGGAAPTQEEMR